jgi:polygalacturonase
VTIKDLTFKRAGFWTIHLLYSQYCSIDGAVIRNNIDGHGPSTDGIDIDSSSRILVENCDIDCNDDNFCLKAGQRCRRLRINRPTEYVVIRNCISRAGGGLLTCGSETSGGIRYVLAHNLKAQGTTVGIRFKSA